MALVDSMDVAAEQEHQQQLRPNPATAGAAAGALSSCHSPTHQGQVEPQPGQDEEEPGQQHSPIQRVDTPCPAALRRQQLQGGGKTQGGSFVLLPDCAERGSRRFIPLEAGQTTVVGRSKSSGIRDHHVSRRHVEVTVPAEREEGSTEGCCRIKYIGRNCRVVLVGGTLLKAEQEVPAGAGARVVLNYNNKGLPRYSYTLVPANSLPAMVTSAGRRSSGMGAMAAGGRGTSANSRRWRDESSPSRLAGGDDDGGGGGGGVGGQQYFHADPHPHAYNHLHRHSRHATLAARQRHQHQHQQQQRQRPTGGRFRKETQDKLQKERDEIFSKFADLKFV